MTKTRIEILDGFRALAIIAVMFCHFFSTGKGVLYPYGNNYNYFALGGQGVQFFFMISGFVIFFTLENTQRFRTFWKNRVIRLLPSMLVASLLTFCIFILFDKGFIFPQSHAARNFLPSVTFTGTNFWNATFQPVRRFQYIDGSYWSLWPEIQFYVFASILFFLNREKFVRNFVIAAVLVIGLHFLLVNIFSTNKLGIVFPGAVTQALQYVKSIFTLPVYLPFFALGVLFYVLFKAKHNGEKVYWAWPLLLLFFLTSLYAAPRTGAAVSYGVMFLLFLVFVYLPAWLGFFKHKLMVRVGIASYFLYLIHCHIGVLIINRLAGYAAAAAFVFVLVLMLALIFVSIVYTEKIERRISNLLKGKRPPAATNISS